MENNATKTALVTGSSGFIGSHVSQRLLGNGYRVIGLDALTDYYDVDLKRRRQDRLEAHPAFQAIKDRIEAPGCLLSVMQEHRPDVVIHLAAQAGVRHSIDAPRSYVEANLAGTYELLEAMRAHPPKHALLASTSSVYGASKDMPYRETTSTDTPLSFYAATKKATEAMAHSYAHLYNIPTTMFRIFTVYGPWGRPDMALFKFTRAILENQPIDVYNHGRMKRDFTYIDDVVEALWRLIPHPVQTAETPVAPYRVINIGANTPVELSDFVETLEKTIGRPAQKILKPQMDGDMIDTWADVSKLKSIIGYVPDTPIATGIAAFVEWYADYHDVTLPQ